MLKLFYLFKTVSKCTFYFKLLNCKNNTKINTKLLRIR